MFDANDLDFCDDILDDGDGVAEDSMSSKKPESDESYKKDLWMHYSLPLDTRPTQEKLEKIYRMIHSSDPETRQDGKTLLLGCTSSYILSVIKKRYRTYMPLYLADMMQQGYFAVIKDAVDFDPTKGSLTTFYAMRIDHSIQNFLNGLHGSTPHYTSANKKIREFIKRRNEKGLDYSMQDVCIETDLPMTTVLQCMKINATKKVSLDTTEILDTLQNVMRTPEEVAIANEEIAYVRRLIEETDLSNKEKICICVRYGVGMDDDRMHSYGEVQDIMDNYGYHMSQNEIIKTISDTCKKLKNEHGKIRRATACNRIRTDIDRRISGDMVSKMSTKNDQEAVAEYFRTGILRID